MSPIALEIPAPLKPVAAAAELPTPPRTPAPATSAQFHMAAPSPIAAASTGLTFTLADGREVMDAMSGGAAVACLGAYNPDIVDVMTRQAATLPYTYHQVLGNSASEDLARFLVDRSGGAFAAAAFLNSGSEAIEATLKLVRQYWVERGMPERKYIIARFPSYHGNTLGALGAGNVPARRDIYAPYIPDVFQHVPSPTYKRSHRAGESEEAYSARLAADLEAKILELGAENVAAFYAEPVVGTALGVMPPPKGYFPAIRAVLDKYDVLLVMDEVMSGAGRSGTLYAWESVAEGVRPHIQSMAKGLGAGYVTVSAILASHKVYDVINAAGQWKNSHTYQNHPINCAVALAVLRKMETMDVYANVKARGAQIVDELKTAFAEKECKTVFDVRGQGLFIGVEFEFDAQENMKPRFAARVKAQCFKNGLVTLGMSGTVDGAAKGDSLVLAPAYIVTKEEISKIVEIVVKSVKEVEVEAGL